MKQPDEALYKLLQYYGPLNRSQICELLKVARTSVYDALRRLQAKELVWRDIEQNQNGQRGRPKTLWGVIEE